MNGFKMVVDGFVFTDEKTAQKACQEEDGIQYIKDRLDMEKPRMVLEMYHKLLAEQVFETPVGLVYLKELQNYLLAVPEMAEEHIEAISFPEESDKAQMIKSHEAVGQAGMMQTDGEEAGMPQAEDGQAMTPQAAARRQETLEWYVEKLEESRQQERLSDYRRRRAEERAKESKQRLRISLLVSLFLLLVTIGVGAITLTDQNPNILNYENKIIQKYQDWEADLQSREQIIKEKELKQAP